MTNPTLERAARALYRADPENYGTEDDMWSSYVAMARAVLMAVLERDIEGDLVLTQDLKAILNDGEGE